MPCCLKVDAEKCFCAQRSKAVKITTVHKMLRKNLVLWVLFQSPATVLLKTYLSKVALCVTALHLGGKVLTASSLLLGQEGE